VSLLLDLFGQGLQMALVIAAAPLLLGWTRLFRARLLRRRGPGLLQPARDLLRLVRKEPIRPETSSWLFRVAPYLIFTATWIAAALIPTYATGLMFHWAADLIAIVAFLGFARFFQALAGLDAGTAFGGIGASRESLVAALAEPAMLLVVFTVALVAGSTQLSQVATHLQGGQVGLRVSLAMALVALILVAIAENARIPVDNPATHLELTMVHEAMLLEHSGRHLALMEAAAALKLVAYLSLIACIFAPFGIATAGAGPAAAALGLVAWGVKLWLLATLLVLFETSIAKMRVFRVPELLGAALMLGFLGTLLLFVSQGL
jgi:formate hydrogenlyase subunit 4